MKDGFYSDWSELKEFLKFDCDFYTWLVAKSTSFSEIIPISNKLLNSTFEQLSTIADLFSECVIVFYTQVILLQSLNINSGLAPRKG